MGFNSVEQLAVKAILIKTSSSVVRSTIPRRCAAKRVIYQGDCNGQIISPSIPWALPLQRERMESYLSWLGGGGGSRRRAKGCRGLQCYSNGSAWYRWPIIEFRADGLFVHKLFLALQLNELMVNVNGLIGSLCCLSRSYFRCTVKGSRVNLAVHERSN